MRIGSAQEVKKKEVPAGGDWKERLASKLRLEACGLECQKGHSRPNLKKNRAARDGQGLKLEEAIYEKKKWTVRLNRDDAGWALLKKTVVILKTLCEKEEG